MLYRDTEKVYDFYARVCSGNYSIMRQAESEKGKINGQ